MIDSNLLVFSIVMLISAFLLGGAYREYRLNAERYEKERQIQEWSLREYPPNICPDPDCEGELVFRGSCLSDTLCDFFDCPECEKHWSHNSRDGWEPWSG